MIDHHSQLGIVIGEKKYWNQGIGQEAIQLACDYAFNSLNLNSLMAGTFEFNHWALACYQRVGFKEIGRRREARTIGDQKYDEILLDLLASEFNSPVINKIIEKILESPQ